MSTDETEIKEPIVTKSANWRVIYSDTTGLNIHTTELRIYFAFDLRPAKPRREILEEAVVVMNPSVAKMLTYMLTGAIRRHEEIHGVIELTPAAQKRVDEALAAGWAGVDTKETKEKK